MNNVAFIFKTWAANATSWVARVRCTSWKSLTVARNDFGTALRQLFDSTICAAYTYRIPLLVSAVAFIVMSQPAQIQELYILTLGQGLLGWLQITFVVFLTFVLSFTLLILTNVASRYFPRSKETRSYKIIDALIKTVCALLPISAIQHGAYEAVHGRLNENMVRFYRLHADLAAKYPKESELGVFTKELIDWQQFPASLQQQLLFSSVVGFLMLLFFLTPYSRRKARGFFDHLIGADAPLVSSRLYHLVLIFTALLVLIFLFPSIWSLPDFFVEIPRIMGGLAIVLLFLIVLSWHLSALSEIADRRGYPVLTLVAGSALLFSYFDLNDNHGIRSQLLYPRQWLATLSDPRWHNDGSIHPLSAANRVERGNKYYYDVTQELPLNSLAAAFAQWFEARPADVKARFADAPYPVYIVAAEGGGIYAATQTAIFLARLFDQCPALTNHIFAVSGVSGGSLGASIIAALVTRKQRELGHKSAEYFSSCSGHPEPVYFFERAAKKLLAEDYLSPSLGAGLFPDFLQRFLPIPIGTLDRARSLERSIEQSWSKLFPLEANPFAANFREHWVPWGFVPMLILNTTNAGSGYQEPIAPYYGGFFGGGMSARYDIPLSTAVGLSARFTVIAPAGRHIDNDGPGKSIYSRSPRFVDGGYVENSGVEVATSAASQIVSVLHSERQSQSQIFQALSVKFDFHILNIGTSSGGYLAPAGLNELASPVAAMYNSRIQRTENAINNIGAYGFTPLQVGISWKHFAPPLGWLISPYTIETIGAHIGTAERCVGPAILEPNEASLHSRAREIDPKSDSWSSEDRVRNFLTLWHQLRHNHCTACSMIQRAQGKTLSASEGSTGEFSADQFALFQVSMGQIRQLGWYPHAISCGDPSSIRKPLAGELHSDKP